MGPRSNLIFYQMNMKSLLCLFLNLIKIFPRLLALYGKKSKVKFWYTYTPFTCARILNYEMHEIRRTQQNETEKTSCFPHIFKLMTRNNVPSFCSTSMHNLNFLLKFEFIHGKNKLRNAVFQFKIGFFETIMPFRLQYNRKTFV